MELSTVDKVVDAFYRLVGAEPTDPSLLTLGQAANDVAYSFLTRGSRNAQRWMLHCGYQGWRKRSSALTWSGTDATTGGRYSALPADFLRAYGSRRISALVEAGGTQWGYEITGPEGYSGEGDGYYYKGDELWLGRTANIPGTVYLEYHHLHPLWDASITIDFPLEARSLIVAEAAFEAMNDSWFPGGPESDAKIDRAVQNARKIARDIARVSKRPNEFMRAKRAGNRW